MKRRFKQWIPTSICAALILALLLTACGGGSAAGGGSGSAGSGDAAESGGSSTAGGAAGGGAGGEDAAAPETAPADADADAAYNENGIVLTVTDTTEEGGFYFVSCDITNRGDKEVKVQLYPLVVNESVDISEGIFETIEAGDTIHTEVGFLEDKFTFAGMSSIGKIEGYIQLSDTEKHEPFTEIKRVTLVAGEDGGDLGKITHSDQVMYDKEGIRISYLGSFKSTYNGIEPVFFATNDTAASVAISTPYGKEIIDGKPAEDRTMIFEDATIMPGDSALVTAHVRDEENYEIADFTYLDLTIEVATEKADTGAFFEEIPCHLKLEGDTIVLTDEAAPVPEEEEKEEKEDKAGSEEKDGEEVKEDKVGEEEKEDTKENEENREKEETEEKEDAGRN